MPDLTLKLTGLPSAAAWRTLRALPSLDWADLEALVRLLALQRDGGAPEWGVAADAPVRVCGRRVQDWDDYAGGVDLYRPSYAALGLLRRSSEFAGPDPAARGLFHGYVLAHARDRRALQALTPHNAAATVAAWADGLTVTPEELAAASLAACEGFPVTAVTDAADASEVARAEYLLCSKLVEAGGGEFDRWYWDQSAQRALWVVRLLADEATPADQTTASVKAARRRLNQFLAELRAKYSAPAPATPAPAAAPAEGG